MGRFRTEIILLNSLSLSIACLFAANIGRSYTTGLAGWSRRIILYKIVLHKVSKHQWFQSNFRKKYVCWWKTSVQVNLSTKQVAQVQNSVLKLSGQNVAPLSLGSFFRFFSLQSAQKKVNYCWTGSIMTKTVYLQ